MVFVDSSNFFILSKRTILALATFLLTTTGLLLAALPTVTTVEADGDVHLRWPVRKGFHYKIERSTDLQIWSDIGYPVYGYLNSDQDDLETWTSLRVFSPPLQNGNPAHPSAEPTFSFFLKRAGDDTFVSWNRASTTGGVASAYLDQDWSFPSIPNADSSLALKPIRIVSNGFPYLLVIFLVDNQALPTPLLPALPPDLGDQDHLALLTGAYTEVLGNLQNPPPVSPTPAVANGAGGQEYFRIEELASDSDDDGIFDSHEFQLGLNPLAADTTGNGVEDPWDGIATSLVISEFMASNTATATDDDGEYSDWIEILNPTPFPVPLDGWHLTDKPGGGEGDVPDLAKWAFPSGITLPAGGTLLVWASNESRRVAGSPLHTNFKLDADDDGIGIVNELGVLVDSHRWTTSQSENRSAGWGIDNLVAEADGRTRKLRYFGAPTPGLLNKMGAFVGVCESPVFSKPAGVYSGEAFPVSIIHTPGTALTFTTDFSVPTEDSPEYLHAITVEGTTIIRAVATAPDCLPSPVVTASYLFKEDVLGTASQGQIPTDHQVKPEAYPDSTSMEPYLIDYEMDPILIQANKDELMTQLSLLPTVSLVLPPRDFFSQGSGGIYANSSISDQNELDPQGNKWRRLASLEYIGANNSQWVQETGELSIAGNSSIQPSQSAKHGLKIGFDGKFSSTPEGAMRFLQDPFTNATLTKYKTLMLRNATHDSWTLGCCAFLRNEATYTKEAWARATHAAMGHRIAQRQWVHLYIDGLYWGLYDFSERINEEYMKADGQMNAEYDVRKWADAEDGDLIAWDEMIRRAQEAETENAPLNSTFHPKWTALTEMIDLDNYIDYLIVNQYIDPLDWAANWRAARRKDLDDRTDPDNIIYASAAEAQRFQFFIWDAEASMVEGRVGFDRSGDDLGSAVVHGHLLSLPKYQEAWKNRVALHFDAVGGAFGLEQGVDGNNNPIELHQASIRFDLEAALFDLGSHCESARWGDSVGGAVYTRTHWLTNAPARSNWLATRRAYFLNHLQTRGLAD